MFHKPVSGLAGIVLLVLCASIADAQDFHVVTQIYNLDEAPQKSGKLPSRGGVETLFHAGKCYDHFRDSSEVTIYEPTQQRFVIIDESRNLRTSISFDEITGQLADARAEIQAFMAGADQRGVRPELIAFYKFQLKPQFEVQLKQQKTTPPILVFSNVFLEYQVECARGKSPELISAYLDYADWLARLNFVARRQSMLPDVRLAVNAELRKRDLLPIKVTLNKKIQEPLRVRSEHQYSWELNGSDKSMISRWEAKETVKTVKNIPWDEYMKTTFQTQAKK